MSQSFRITVNNQDYFFRILSPVNINNQTAEIKVEIDKDVVVNLKKVAETWQEGIEQFPKQEVVQAILKAICLRFRV
jgi:hypothetical protein